MRIVFLLPPLAMAGGIKVAVIYAKAFKAMGHQVIIISPPHKVESLFNRARKLLRGRGWHINTRQRPSQLDGSGLDYCILDRHRPIMSSDVPDADIVIATWWETAEWANALPATCGAKVYLIQGHEIFPYLPVQRCHATYRMPMHQIVIAKWLEDVMRNQYGSTQVDLIENSVDRDQFFAPVRPKNSVPTVGFLYSSSSLKGVDVTIKVIKKLRAEFTNLRVVSFGSQQEVKHLKLPRETEFIFCPEQSEIRNIYAKCDVWLTASRTEGFNLPALEAMACRTPVVSTKVGWAAEAVVDGYNGALADVDDVEALVEKTKAILNLEDLAWRLVSSHAYKTSSKGSWDESARKFENVLLEIVNRN